MGKNCANTDEFDSKQKVFGSINEMQDSIGKRINNLMGISTSASGPIQLGRQ